MNVAKRDFNIKHLFILLTMSTALVFAPLLVSKYVLAQHFRPEYVDNGLVHWFSGFLVILVSILALAGIYTISCVLFNWIFPKKVGE